MFASSLCFQGDGEIAANFANDLTVSYLAWWCIQTAEHEKTGKYFFERGIIALHFGEKYASLPLPILRNHGWLVVQVLFKTVAAVTRFIIIHQMSPRASSDVQSRLLLLWSITQYQPSSFVLIWSKCMLLVSYPQSIWSDLTSCVHVTLVNWQLVNVDDSDTGFWFYWWKTTCHSLSMLSLFWCYLCHLTMINPVFISVWILCILHIIGMFYKHCMWNADVCYLML